MTVSKSELRIFSAVGISAGQVTFATLFASLFAVDNGNFILILFSLILTLFFWGVSSIDIFSDV